jgi:prolipoprotein diacylglyceryltransferase
MGMLLSVPLIALGFAFIAYALREPRRATEP